MITNHDVEIAFVRAQNRINENLEKAQMQFIAPDMEKLAEVILAQVKQSRTPKVNENNPIANEEI